MFYTNHLRDWIDFLNSTNQNLKWESSITFPKTPKNRKWEIEARQVENGFEVEMVVPGYEKDDIKIEVESTYLKVSAEENKRGNSFLERIAIPDHCELQEITAEYKNGILTLFFPVNEEQESGFSIKVK